VLNHENEAVSLHEPTRPSGWRQKSCRWSNDVPLVVPLCRVKIGRGTSRPAMSSAPGNVCPRCLCRSRSSKLPLISAGCSPVDHGLQLDGWMLSPAYSLMITYAYEQTTSEKHDQVARTVDIKIDLRLRHGRLMREIVPTIFLWLVITSVSARPCIPPLASPPRQLDPIAASVA